jgi:hypothetical protein
LSCSTTCNTATSNSSNEGATHVSATVPLFPAWIGLVFGLVCWLLLQGWLADVLLSLFADVEAVQCWE